MHVLELNQFLLGFQIFRWVNIWVGPIQLDEKPFCLLLIYPSLFPNFFIVVVSKLIVVFENHIQILEVLDCNVLILGGDFLE